MKKLWNAFAQLVADIRWRNNMLRVLRFRRGLEFSERQIFDSALRRPISGGVIAYPDAIYHIRIEDYLRAMERVFSERRYQRARAEIRLRTSQW